ncbi:MAG: D-Ala-D-Ala carboxypeptidase family metallohydrolase [Pseudomonadota bacterium]
MSPNSMVQASARSGFVLHLLRLLVALTAMSFVFASSASAEGDGALEWEKGGMFERLTRPSVNRKVAKKLRRKIKQTNLGGIRATRKKRKSAVSKKRRNSRKARRNSRRSQRRVRVASLGNSFKLAVSARKGGKSKKPKSITGGARGVTWVARKGCLNGRLKAAIYHVARTYGRVRVNSTCRSRRHNRRVGGARRSLHLTGNAADIRIWGNVRAAARYLRGVAGGYKHYGGGLFHIDTGPRRSW